ncbi:aldehyde ferredoxin oxidoreductase N-terminal domain-containing protein [Chloroflexota bacterium]
MVDYGYAGQILSVDLVDRKVTSFPTSDYVDGFLGGRGLAAKLYWDMVPSNAGALSSENALICATGPIAGFPGFAGGRWQICGKSQLGEKETFNYANLGGRWGTWLKYAGYDALVIRGKSETPAYLYINNETVEIRDATALWGRSALEVYETLSKQMGKRASILAIGPAGENLVTFATVFADEGASGSGGLGAVMGSKNLKAVVVEGDKRPVANDPVEVKRLVRLLTTLIQKRPFSMWGIPGMTRAHYCFGCGIGCDRQMYRIPNSSGLYKHFCQATEVYHAPAQAYFGAWNEVELLAIRLCDGYGVDTSVMQSIIEWLIACYRNGLLDETDTGIPFSRVGSAEFIETLIRKISYREGFGDVLARGIPAAAKSLGAKAEEILPEVIATRGGEKKDYDPRLMIITGILYATEPRRPIQQLHEVLHPLVAWGGFSVAGPGASPDHRKLRDFALKFWGSEIAADFSTYQGKGVAAKHIQDFSCVKESLAVCDMRWRINMPALPGDDSGANGLGARILTAITGHEWDTAALDTTGERIFNLQRALLLRDGWLPQRDDNVLDYFFSVPLKEGELFFNHDCVVPGGRDEVLSKKGAVLDRQGFEEMKREYYLERGWDTASGLPRRTTLERLGMGDIARELEQNGLLA